MFGSDNCMIYGIWKGFEVFLCCGFEFSGDVWDFKWDQRDQRDEFLTNFENYSWGGGGVFR